MSDASDAEVWRLELTDGVFARLAAVVVRASVCLPTVVVAEPYRLARSDEATLVCGGAGRRDIMIIVIHGIVAAGDVVFFFRRR